jgi:hypothetical protein
MRVFVFICFGLLATAQADNKQAAREAYKEGSRLYDLMDYKGALEAFKKAYVNFEEPTLLFNIAQCHRYLGQKVEALTSYRTYLRKAPTAPNAEDVRKLVAQLEAAMEHERRASNAPPSGTLAPPGGAGGSKSRETMSGQTRPAETKPAETKPQEPAVVEATKPAEAKPVETPAPVEKKNQPLVTKWWLWTAVGGGVVVIALAVGLGVGLSGGESPYPSTGAGTVFRF